MNAQIDQALSQAYDMIEQERLEDARRILKPLLESQKDNADVWWLYAHAVADPETARLALNNVIRLDPEYPNANERLNQLEDQMVMDVRSASDDASLREPSFLPPAPATLPGLSKVSKSDDDGDEWDIPDDDDEDFDGADEKPFYQKPIFLLVAMLLVFVIIAALVVLRPGSQQGGTLTATPTLLVANPTLDSSLITQPALETPITNQSAGETEEASLESPTDEVATETTSEEPTEAATTDGVEPSGDFEGLASSLSTYTLAESGIRVASTNLGNTLVVDVCTTAGTELRGALRGVLNTVAGSADASSSGVQAIAARMMDCGTNTELLAIGTSTQNAADYASGTADQQAFEARWQPIIIS